MSTTPATGPVSGSEKPSVWTEFHQRHERRKFTPAFNSYLEAQIADQRLALDVRIGAWLLRSSWGNHSDSCVDGQGVIQTQADCGRALRVDRRVVNLPFQDYEERGYIRFKGREILLVDDPRRSAPDEGEDPPPFPTNGEENGKDDPLKSFDAYLAKVVASRDPAGYALYHQAAEQVKQFRTAYLPTWKEFRKSERVGQTDSPNGSDNGSERTGQTLERGPTNATASLYENENVKTSEVDHPQVEKSASDTEKVAAPPHSTNTSTPPATSPPQTLPKEVIDREPEHHPLDDPNPIVQFVQHHFKRRFAANDELQVKFAELAGKFQVPARTVARFLADKVQRAERRRYPITTPGALYQFATEDLATWIQQHMAECQSDFTWQRRQDYERALAENSRSMRRTRI